MERLRTSIPLRYARNSIMGARDDSVPARHDSVPARNDSVPARHDSVPAWEDRWTRGRTGGRGQSGLARNEGNK